MSTSAFRLPTPEVTDPCEMMHLYEGLQLITDVMAGLLCQPRFGEPPNAAGSYLHRLSEAIDRANEDLVAAVKAMRPDESADDFSDVFAARAHILVREKLNHEGITAAADLVKEIYCEDASS